MPQSEANKHGHLNHKGLKNRGDITQPYPKLTGNQSLTSIHTLTHALPRCIKLGGETDSAIRKEKELV